MAHLQQVQFMWYEHFWQVSVCSVSPLYEIQLQAIHIKENFTNLSTPSSSLSEVQCTEFGTCGELPSPVESFPVL